MGKLARFGVSVEKGLAAKFDRLLERQGYSNRSEAIKDLMRNALVEEEWLGRGAGEVSGVISLVYDHHKRDLVNKLTDVQHDHSKMIISTQHIHLDHNNCLEVIVVKGGAGEASKLAKNLRAAKGVKHGGLIMATTGRDLK